ncbi:MAG: hypothetical protein CMJ31_03025 [Phycisphaerae bacterium]|nr:hypothetical protein [Phycisphaerae bacterium]
MIPKPPPREGPLGFLYIHPFRVQGISVAGEVTCVQVPELDVVFDIGACPRAMLASKFCCLSHGHMDHIGSLAYWCSQRQFQGMGEGTIVCDARIADAVHAMMAGYVALERQKTPYNLISISPGDEIEIKNNHVLRCFETEHTCPSIGYVVVEKRTKLKPELMGMPQEKLRELKERGEEIVNHLEVPLVAYTGDTLPGAHLLNPLVMNAQVIITECTFFEPEHKERATVGMHMHIDDIAEWLRVSTCQSMVLGHVSRRTHISYAIKRIEEVCGPELASRVLLLMDHRANKARYERQAAEAERKERELRRR